MMAVRDLSEGLLRLPERTYGLIGLYIRWLLFQLVKLQGFTIHNPGNLPSEIPGHPFLVVANHESYIEGFLLPLMGGTKFKSWSKDTSVGRGLVRRLYSRLTRYTSDPDLLAATHHDMERGINYYIAPEGRRNFGIGLRRGNIGIARLMQAHPKLLMVPMAMTNPRQHNAPHSIFLPHPGWQVVVGRPFKLSGDGARTNLNLKMMQEMVDEAMARIAELLPEHKRGYYRGAAAARRYTENVDITKLGAKRCAA